MKERRGIKELERSSREIGGLTDALLGVAVVGTFVLWRVLGNSWLAHG